MIKKSIIIPIYTCQLDIVIANNLEEIAEDAGYNGDCAGYDALTLSYPANPSIYCMIFREKAVNPGVVAHEVGHLVSKIFMACDIKYDPDNMEPWCYLQGYVTNELHQIIWPQKKKKS